MKRTGESPAWALPLVRRRRQGALLFRTSPHPRRALRSWGAARRLDHARTRSSEGGQGLRPARSPTNCCIVQEAVLFQHTHPPKTMMTLTLAGRLPLVAGLEEGWVPRERALLLRKVRRRPFPLRRWRRLRRPPSQSRVPTKGIALLHTFQRAQGPGPSVVRSCR
jgi:hypothetical protein